MPSRFFFTINMLLKSESNIKEAVENIITDERYFRENVQLILIDPIGSPEVAEICAQLNTKYPENIVFVDAAEKNPASCYNHARPFALGSYISFIDNHSYYEKGSLKRAQEILKNKRIPVFCMECVTENPGGIDTVYAEDIDDGIVRLHETPDRLILHEGCWFFLSSATSSLRFDTDIHFHYEQKYLIEAMNLTYSYVYSSECTFITTNPSEHEGNRYAPQYNTDFYIRSLREFIIPMLKSYAGSYLVQSAMMYLLGVKLALNAGRNYKGILTGNRLEEFFSLCSEAFNYIEDSVIISPRLLKKCGLDLEYGFALLKMKYKNPKLVPETDIAAPNTAITKRYRTAPNRLEDINLSGEFAAHIGEMLIMRSKDISVNIKTLNFGEDGMYIDAELIGASALGEENFSVYAVINGARSRVIRSDVYTDRTIFGRVMYRRYAFRLFVPVSSGKAIDTVCFNFKHARLSFRMPMTFEGIHSRLSEKLRGSCAVFYGRAVSYDAKTKSLAVRRATESLITLAENRLLGTAAKNEGLSARLYYQRLRHMAKSIRRSDDTRRIFVFYDETGINSNGNLLFRYFTKHGTDTAVSYFITDKNSPEAVLLADAGYENILEKGSTRAKAVALAANFIIATDNDSYSGLGFTEEDRLYLRDMASAQIISVRNRFLCTPRTDIDNRLADNIRTIFTASNEEKQALLSPELDYDEDMIITAGNPLLDALTDKREKLILISPGRRRIFEVYDHSSLHRFTESIFHREYSALLSDPALLNICRRFGYKLALMLPKEAEKYERTFPQTDLMSVYFETEQNITWLVSHASLLITDYSELQYRFAYLKKSVMYFYPPGLPSTAEPEGEGISRRGFGEVFFDREKLIEAVCLNMEKQFPLKDKYAQRCDSFFEHNDKENCARIFELLE